MILQLKPLLSSSQQKLVLRNNSATITQQLRLLIRGQDQDCFQVCLSFSNFEVTYPFYLFCYNLVINETKIAFK